MSIPLLTASHELCGAKTKGGGTCRQPAGSRTDHPGTGRCWLHGGRKPIKHGRYANVLRGELGRHIIEHMDDENPLDLAPEMAVLRGQLTLWLDRLGEFDNGVTPEQAAAIGMVVSGLQRLADTVSKIETRAALTTREMTYVVCSLADILREEIEDADQLRRILGKMERRVLVRQVPLLEGEE